MTGTVVCQRNLSECGVGVSRMMDRQYEDHPRASLAKAYRQVVWDGQAG